MQKNIAVTPLSPSKSSKYEEKNSLVQKFGSTSENGDANPKLNKKFELEKSLDDSTEGVEQVEEIEDDGDE